MKFKTIIVLLFLVASSFAQQQTSITFEDMSQFQVQRNFRQGTVARLKEPGDVSEWVWDSTDVQAADSTADGPGIVALGPGGTGRWVRRFEGPVNPTWWGAAPTATGVVNRTAIVAALAASNDVLIGTPGVYDIDGATISIPVNTTLRAVDGVTIRSTNPTASAALIDMSNDGATLDGLVIDQSAGLLGKLVGYTLVSLSGNDCTIRNCEIFADGLNGLTTDPGILPVFVNDNPARVNIENCNIHDSSVTYGLQVHNGGSDISITDTRIVRNAADGLKLTGSTLVSGMKVINCFIENNGYGLSSGGAEEQEDGVDINCPVRGITFSSTRFANNAGSGAIVKETGTANIGSVSYVNCTFSNNRIHGSMVFGPNGVRNVLYTGCAFAENGSAISTFANGSDTWTSPIHGFENDDRVTLTTNGTLPTGYNPSTSYFVVGATANTYQLSLTSGGAAVDGTDDGVGMQHARHTSMVGNAGAGLHVSGANTGVSNCLMRRNFDSGLYVSGAVNTIVNVCQFHANGHGLGANSRNITIANNASGVKVSDCVALGIDPYGDDVDPANYGSATIYTQRASLVTAGSTDIMYANIKQQYHSSSEKFANSAGSEFSLKGRDNFIATVVPTATDDISKGYYVGSRWINTATAKEYVATATAVGAANWVETTVVGGGGDLLSTNNLSDVANVATSRTNLGVDPAGTDNSTNVTLLGTPDYLTIAGQAITRNPIDLTAAADVTGILPIANVASGTPNGTQFVRDDGVLAVPPQSYPPAVFDAGSDPADIDWTEGDFQKVILTLPWSPTVSFDPATPRRLRLIVTQDTSALNDFTPSAWPHKGDVVLDQSSAAVTVLDIFWDGSVYHFEENINNQINRIENVSTVSSTLEVDLDNGKGRAKLITLNQDITLTVTHVNDGPFWLGFITNGFTVTFSGFTVTPDAPVDNVMYPFFATP